jgi:hypothetical protein
MLAVKNTMIIVQDGIARRIGISKFLGFTELDS